MHRIGRTARAGHGGNAISLCDGTERESLRNVERLTRLRIFTIDRRGANGPAPAPVLRKATPAAPALPHHSAHNDPRARVQNAKPGLPHRQRRQRPAFQPRIAPAPKSPT